MESKIKQNVMRRVRTIHTVRPFTGGVAVAFALLGISLYALGRFVFVAQIFRNMPAIQDVGAVLRFVTDAFLNTEFFVQALTIVALVSMLWMIRDATRTFGFFRTA